MDNKMDIIYSEEKFNTEFSVLELEILIKYHLETKENVILDFKSESIQKKFNKFTSDLKKDIQAFMNTKGGIIIIGVDQNNKDTPIKGVLNTDKICIAIDQISEEFGIPILSPIRIILNKTLIFVIIPQIKTPKLHNSTIRIRRGSKNSEKVTLEELEELKIRLKNESSGFGFIKDLKNTIKIYRIELLKRNPNNHLLYQDILIDSYKTDITTIKLFSAISNKLNMIHNIQLNETIQKGDKKIRYILLATPFIIIFAPVLWLLTKILNFDSTQSLEPFLLSDFLIATLYMFFGTLIGSYMGIYIRRKRTKIKIIKNHEIPDMLYPGVPEFNQSLIDDPSFNSGINYLLNTIFSIQILQFLSKKQVSPFSRFSEFKCWIESQKYAPDITILPDKTIIECTKYIVLKPWLTKEENKDDFLNQYQIDKNLIDEKEKTDSILSIELVQYNLLYYLFLLEQKQISG